MSTFKEYKKTKEGEIPSIETFMGTHSQKKTKKTPSIETSFGTHSQKVNEQVFTDAHKSHMLTSAQDAQAHLHTAPIHSEGLSGGEKDAIESYTDDSTRLNGLLHRHDKGVSRDEDATSPNKHNIDQLDNVMNRHKTTADMHVFTGIHFTPSKHFRKVAGKIPTSVHLHMPAFTSTSTSLTTAAGFSLHTSHPNDDRHGVNSEEDEKQHVLKIHVPEGSHAMSMMKHSFVPGEKEILLHRGHTIEVHHKPEDVGNHTFLWHAKVVDHKLADLSKAPE